MIGNAVDLAPGRRKGDPQQIDPVTVKMGLRCQKGLSEVGNSSFKQPVHSTNTETFLEPLMEMLTR